MTWIDSDYKGQVVFNPFGPPAERCMACEGFYGPFYWFRLCTLKLCLECTLSAFCGTYSQKEVNRLFNLTGRSQTGSKPQSPR